MDHRTIVSLLRREIKLGTVAIGRFVLSNDAASKGSDFMNHVPKKESPRPRVLMGTRAGSALAGA